MSAQARKAFKEMVDLCYEEDYPELHKEIYSLQVETKRNKDTYKYETAINELLEIIPLFADDFPSETMAQIEQIYEEFIEQNE
jgi:hypothetical protein